MSDLPEFPKLKEGWVRCVHYIRPQNLNAQILEGIKTNGFIYSGAYRPEYHAYFGGRYGTIESMARAYSNPRDADRELEKLITPPIDFDERFIGGGALIFDMPADLYRLHSNINVAPGFVDKKYFRAIYHPDEGLQIMNDGEIKAHIDEAECLRRELNERHLKHPPLKVEGRWASMETVQCGPEGAGLDW